MARKIWRYSLTKKEQALWDREDLKGWRAAFIGCVEDDAREEGCKKFMIHDTKENLLVKDEVSKLPELETAS